MKTSDLIAIVVAINVAIAFGAWLGATFVNCPPCPEPEAYQGAVSKNNVFYVIENGVARRLGPGEVYDDGMIRIEPLKPEPEPDYKTFYERAPKHPRPIAVAHEAGDWRPWMDGDKQ